VPHDALTLVLVYADALGTYGDRGNAIALRHRAEARGLACETVEVEVGEVVPRQGDIYLIGGGEDGSVLAAERHLHVDVALTWAVDHGAACLGVCAGYQLLAQEFTGPDGERHPGLGLLDVCCGRLRGPRAVGEVLVADVQTPGVTHLTGFENHQGDARLGPDARPLGRVVRGTGNGDGSEGAVHRRVVGTYLHGPVLVRNAALADQLLTSVAGPLAAFDDGVVERLRQERCRAALASPRGGTLRRLGRPRRSRRRRGCTFRLE
jgi:CobQ-like glutamine amidotransferase family enzyme